MFVLSPYIRLKSNVGNYKSLTSLKRLIADLTVVAAVVEYTYAPPATVRRQRLQDQIPTQALFMDS